MVSLGPKPVNKLRESLQNWMPVGRLISSADLEHAGTHWLFHDHVESGVDLFSLMVYFRMLPYMMARLPVLVPAVC